MKSENGQNITSHKYERSSSNSIGGETTRDVTLQNQQLHKNSRETINNKYERFLDKSVNIFRSKGPCAVDFATLSSLMPPTQHNTTQCLANKLNLLDHDINQREISKHNSLEKDHRQFVSESINQFKLKGPKYVDFLKLSEILAVDSANPSINDQHSQREFERELQSLQSIIEKLEVLKATKKDDDLKPPIRSGQNDSFILNSIGEFKSNGPYCIDFYRLSNIFYPEKLANTELNLEKDKNVCKHELERLLSREKGRKITPEDKNDITQPLSSLEKEFLGLKEDPNSDETTPVMDDYDDINEYYSAVVYDFLTSGPGNGPKRHSKPTPKEINEFFSKCC